MGGIYGPTEEGESYNFEKMLPSGHIMDLSQL